MQAYFQKRLAFLGSNRPIFSQMEGFTSKFYIFLEVLENTRHVLDRAMPFHSTDTGQRDLVTFGRVQRVINRLMRHCLARAFSPHKPEYGRDPLWRLSHLPTKEPTRNSVPCGCIFRAQQGITRPVSLWQWARSASPLERRISQLVVFF